MFDPLITASILIFSNAEQSNAKSIAASGSSKESHDNDVYVYITPSNPWKKKTVVETGSMIHGFDSSKQEKLESNN